MSSLFFSSSLFVITPVYSSDQAPVNMTTRALPGYWNNAHHGGVKALETQTGAFWGNPGGLYLIQSQKIETSVYNMGDRPGIHASWVVPAGEVSTLGVSLQSQPVESLLREELRAGFGVRPTSSLSLGAIGVGQFYNDSLFMDFNAGAQYSLTDYFRGGLEVHNITEQLSPGIDSSSQRLYGAGFVYYPMYQQLQQRFFVHLDWESRNLTFEEDRYTAGASFVMGPRENLRLSAAVSRIDLDSLAPLTSSFGIQVQEIFFKSFLSFHYSVSRIPLADVANAPMRHQLGMGIQLNPKQDLTPPSAQVNMSRSLLDFSSQDATLHQAFFTLSAQDNSNQFKSWHLVISSLDESMQPLEVLKSFNGQGQPPKQILWAGRNTSGERLPAGFYGYRLIVLDNEQNHTATSWQFLEIK